MSAIIANAIQDLTDAVSRAARVEYRYMVVHDLEELGDINIWNDRSQEAIHRLLVYLHEVDVFHRELQQDGLVGSKNIERIKSLRESFWNTCDGLKEDLHFVWTSRGQPKLVWRTKAQREDGDNA